MGKLILVFIIFMAGYLFKGIEKETAIYAKKTFSSMVGKITSGFNEADAEPSSINSSNVNISLVDNGN